MLLGRETRHHKCCKTDKYDYLLKKIMLAIKGPRVFYTDRVVQFFCLPCVPVYSFRWELRCTPAQSWAEVCAIMQRQLCPI